MDAMVVRDSDGLPFIPGKTIKGLVREAAEEMMRSSGDDCSFDLALLFGEEGGSKGEAFFSDAVVGADRTLIVSDKLAEFMYRSISSTRIESDGVAADSSLRKVEVVVPCSLEGCILSVPEECGEVVNKSLKYIKRLGLGRNRGLGRCSIAVEL